MWDLNAAQAVTGGAIVMGGVGWLFRWAWTHTHQQIEEIRKQAEEIRRQMEENEFANSARYIEVVKLTTRIDTQMQRFISDMDSEKRTRAEVNREIFVKLERITERLSDKQDRRAGDK